MKHILVEKLGDPAVLQYIEGPDPRPGATQVVVKVGAVGVNPVDTYVRSGVHAQRPLPYTPGSDGAGTIQEVGSDVKNWAPGDRVYLAGAQNGTYAELALCNLDQVYPLPNSIDFAQGAALYVPYSTAYRALFQRGGARPGEWLLVHGASGGVGLAAVQWARAQGLRVIGTAGTEAGSQAVLEAGAHHVLNHLDPEMPTQLSFLTGGQGPVLILEMLANVNLQKDLDFVARYGRIVIIGNRGSLDFNPRATMTKDADVRGMSLFNTPPGEMLAIQQAIQAGLEAGFLRPVIGRQFPLREAAQAHVAVLEPGSLGKIVLIPQRGPLSHGALLES